MLATLLLRVPEGILIRPSIYKAQNNPLKKGSSGWKKCRSLERAGKIRLFQYQGECRQSHCSCCCCCCCSREREIVTMCPVCISLMKECLLPVHMSSRPSLRPEWRIMPPRPQQYEHREGRNEYRDLFLSRLPVSFACSYTWSPS